MTNRTPSTNTRPAKEGQASPDSHDSADNAARKTDDGGTTPHGATRGERPIADVDKNVDNGAS